MILQNHNRSGLEKGTRIALAASATMDSFIKMYERPFYFHIVPLFEKACADSYGKTFGCIADSVNDRVYMQSFVEEFWESQDTTAHVGKIAAVMDVLVAHNSVERFQLILRWWKVYTQYHFQPFLYNRFEDAVRYVVMFHANWCPLGALMDTPGDVYHFASYVFHQIVLKGATHPTQTDMVLAFLGDSLFSSRIRVCTGRMSWGDYFLTETNMDYTVKVHYFLAKKYTKYQPTTLTLAAKALELLFRISRDVPGAIVHFFGHADVMVQRAVHLFEGSEPSEIWDCCCAVHKAIDECDRARAHPPMVDIENRLYMAAMARKGANFKSKKARAFRDMAGKNRITALKKLAVQEKI